MYICTQVWDDDSVADGKEGVNSDDLMGQNAYNLNCFLCPYKLEGNVDRATFDGIGNLYAFRVSFKYEAVPTRLGWKKVRSAAKAPGGLPWNPR